MLNKYYIKNQSIPNTILSFIIPIYNGENYINTCIDSILSAKCDGIEVILIDDCSIDNSSKICKEYADKFNNVVFSQMPSNQGPGAARNAGLKLAQGHFIYFLDSDDYIVSEHLPVLIDTLIENSEVDIVCMNASYGDSVTAHLYTNKFVSEKGVISPEDFANLTNINIPLWVCTFRRKHLLKNQIEFQPLFYCEDNIFFMESLFSACSVFMLPLTFYHHSISVSHSLIYMIRKRKNDYVAGIDAFISICSDWYEKIDSIV